MSLEQFRDLLLTITENVHHLEAYQETDEEYIIWQERGGNSLYGDGVRCETAKKVQIDIYTTKEFSDLPERVMRLLETQDIACKDPIPSYYTETKKMRYIIECEVL